jgi:hypothetical protein
LANTTVRTIANITPKIITVQAIGTDKTYDGTTSDVVSLISNGVLAQDMSNVQFNAMSAFTNKNVGVGKDVVVSNINATGSSSGNYKLSSSSAKAYATVTAKNITVMAAGSNKVYDGSISDVVILSSDGVISGDSVKFDNTSAVFGDKNVGTDKVITVTGIKLSGTDAKNYSYNANTVTNASITPKGLTVMAVGQNKIYDGNTTDAVSLSSSGVVKGDNVSFTNTAATLDSKNVGINKVVTVTGISALGTDALNYTVSNSMATTKATVTPLSISVIATASSKNFDGNKTAVVSLQTNDLIAGDTLSFASTSANFVNSAVGDNKVVKVSGIKTVGIDAANYKLVKTSVTTTGAID